MSPYFTGQSLAVIVFIPNNYLIHIYGLEIIEKNLKKLPLL